MHVECIYDVSMRKRERQAALLKFVGSKRVASQIELANLLQTLGFSVTQASVSRDLDELGITKRNGHYTIPRTTVELGKASFVDAGDNMIVGKCQSGLASAITVRIDTSGIADIIGTIAGDDTIFIAVPN